MAESAPCSCPSAGFCRRFNRRVNAAQHAACQTNAGGYRDHHAALADGKPSPVSGESAPVPPPTPPAIYQKAINFAKAVFNQIPLATAAILTGDESKAFRSQAEIEAIAKTCQSCPLFNGQVCTHKDCGCPIDQDRNRWWSKVAFKSAFCPDNPPRWE